MHNEPEYIFDWQYKYTINYKIKGISDNQKFYDAIKNVQKKYGYGQPYPQMVCFGVNHWMYFTTFSIDVVFHEWGQNREGRNWPVTIYQLKPVVDEFLKAVDGEIESHTLKELPLVYNDVSDKLKLPLEKKNLPIGVYKRKIICYIYNVKTKTTKNFLYII